jgi:arylsulfatase A-like enzyme
MKPGIVKRSPAGGSSEPAAPRILFSLLLFGLASVAAFAQGPKPNLVFILADDLGYGELGSYGQKLIQTPHLDRMAAEGIRFTRFYAGSTVCAPSRSVLMTGQHMGHTRVRGNAAVGKWESQTLMDADVTVAEVLQRSGYGTGLIGKWGLGEAGSEGAPGNQGFEYFYGILNQYHAHNHFPNFVWRDSQKVSLPNKLVQVGEVPGTGYSKNRVAYAGDLFAEEAAAFIERNQARPFFLFLSLIAPHANNERTIALGEGNEVPDQQPYADRPWNDAQKNHAAMITRLDRDVGALLAQLERLGLDERTLVIFTSDNGPHWEGGPEYDPSFFDASGPLSGIKRDLTEGGIRVPLIARWPGRIRPGSESAQVAYFGDLMATFAAIAGAEPPPERDSISLVPTLLGRGRQRQHDFLYWEFYERGVSQAVLLDGRWKALRMRDPSAPIQLFDLERDLAEKTDVAGKHPSIVARAGDLMRTAHVPNEHWNVAAPPPDDD